MAFLLKLLTFFRMIMTDWWQELSDSDRETVKTMLVFCLAVSLVFLVVGSALLAEYLRTNP